MSSYIIPHPEMRIVPIESHHHRQELQMDQQRGEEKLTYINLTDDTHEPWAHSLQNLKLILLEVHEELHFLVALAIYTELHFIR